MSLITPEMSAGQPASFEVGTEQYNPLPEQLTELGKIMAASFGYRADFVVSETDSTFATSFDPESQSIKVILSPQLLARAESSEQIDLFSFAVGHEMGHVRDFKARPPQYGEVRQPKYNYFNNIVDDIAINLNLMQRTRYFASITPNIYDQTLFPRESRAESAMKPRHMQFMDSLILLAMIRPESTRSDFDSDDLNVALDELSLQLNPTVVESLNAAIDNTKFGQRYNLLNILRNHSTEIDQRDLVADALRELYDELYEQDESEQKSGGDGEPSEGEQFDYSDSAGCGHDHNSQPDSQEAVESNEENDEGGDSSEQGEQAGEQSSSGSDQSGLPDFSSIASQIAEAIEKTATEGREEIQRAAEEAKRVEREQAHEKMRESLGLNEDDFAGYLADRDRYSGDIAAFSDIISRLKRERSDHFLAPSHEVRSRGHRINVSKLVGLVASGQHRPSPDIFRAATMHEKLEFEFDGLDMFMLCDISISMRGAKACEAAASFVVIQEGLMSADEVAGDEDLVRVQIQAFGNDNYTLAPLSDRPSPSELGTTYAKIRNPNEGTHVTNSLKEAGHSISNETHLPNRLQLVAVISDGDFADSEAAKIAGQEIEDSGGIILQLVYGDASVSQLSEKAHIVRLDGATSLPQKLFEIVPDLLEEMRRSAHA